LPLLSIEIKPNPVLKNGSHPWSNRSRIIERRGERVLCEMNGFVALKKESKSEAQNDFILIEWPMVIEWFG